MNNPLIGAQKRNLASLVKFLTRDVVALKQSLSDLEREIDPSAVPKRNDAYHQRVLRVFEDSQAACRNYEALQRDDPEGVKDVQAGFLEETDAWFSKSWIGQRARTKPNGFVGDYEMLVKLYDEATPARGLGGYLDLCILDLPLARAVRTRLAGARKFLIEEIAKRTGDVRIMDVASGPCREYRDWPKPTGKQVEIVAMDTDPLALEYVGSAVCPAMPDGVTLKPVRYNALRTSSAEGTIRQFGKFDIIYSVGLCDYLTDEHLIRMMAAWRDTLTDSGVMYVAFKDCDQYDHTPYQWHLDWFFYQRTHEDVLKIFAAAGFDTDAMEVTRDETGIITNYIHRRPSGARYRIDQAQPISGRVSDAAAKPVDAKQA